MPLKRYIQKLILNRSDAPREHKSYCFDTARSVGIVLPVTDENSEEAFGILKSALKKYSIPHSGIAIVCTKKPIGMFWCISDSEMTVINKNEVNWIGLLSNEQDSYRFLKHNFDIAINLSVDGNFTAEYLTRSSRAYFKIGFGNENDNIYDMSMRGHGEKEILTQTDLANQVVQYLSTIKSR